MKPTRILVQRRAAIGDVIMSTGVVRELKKRHENSEIYMATDFPEPYRNNPYISGIVSVAAVKSHIAEFDIYINLDDAYEHNPQQHYLDSYFIRAFGSKMPDQHVELFPDATDQARVRALMSNAEKKYIVVHMRNWHWAAKNITLDTWLSVFELLFEQRADFNVVCVGGSTDYYIEHPLFIDARGTTSQQIKLLCDHARCFAGIDSGPYHCASASDTHIIALLTHLHPERILPYRHWEFGWHATAVQTEEDCRGCNDLQQTPVRQLQCVKGDYRCSGNWDIQRIANTILGTL